MYEFDRAYLADAAAGAWHYLNRGVTCEIAFTPGNGTLYDLVLIPARGLSAVEAWMDHAKARSITKDRPELLAGVAGDGDRWILVGWLGHGFWPVDLAAVWSGGYFAEKFHGATIADGEALRAFLLEIADVAGLRRLQAAS